MITAKEARETYENSKMRIIKYLETDVKPVIIRALEAGECECVIYVDSKPNYQIISPNPFQQSILEELKRLGYRAQFSAFGDTYIPRGLADHDHHGPLYINYGFKIFW